MALVSPGVEVKVIDESFYTPAAAGTVPMVFVATATNKTSSSGAGTAAGALKANAGKPYLITSQRELGETFGDALFYSDNNGNMIHGGELNEYGLQTAYSLLGVSNRAYVVRADIDLAELEASATAPGGAPADGAWWLDTQVSEWGVLEWNGGAPTTTGGQSFTSQDVTVITSSEDLSNSVPKASIGAIGEYLIDASQTTNNLWYKTPGYGNVANRGNNVGTWVQVGSDEWMASWAAVTTSNTAVSTVQGGETIVINGSTVNLTGNTVATLPADIDTANITGVTAAVVGDYVEIYVDSTAASGKAVIAAGTGTALADLGLVAGDYYPPAVAVAPHTSVPAFKISDAVAGVPQDVSNKPTGSIWVKTTEPNGGAKLNVKQYAAGTALWNKIDAPLYATAAGAIYSLDKSGGGLNIAAGSVYAHVNSDEAANPIANYKLFSRASSGATTVTSSKILATTYGGAATHTFTIQETVVNSSSLTSATTVSFDVTGAATGDAEAIAAAINAAGMKNVVALVDSQNRVVISHKLGGEIRVVDTTGGLTTAGFTDDTANLYFTAGTDNTTIPAEYTASNWKPLTYTAAEDEPLSLAAHGRLWYNSVVDEVDILVHNGDSWVGLAYDGSNPSGNGSDVASPYTGTDTGGPIVSATQPTERPDGALAFVTGDIWVSTADVEDYPAVYRYNADLGNWVLLDKTDQTTENGILFADARAGDSGGTTSVAPDATIEELLVSDYLDFDAPDPALYPKGMLLWNLRRSGFNVKRFERNYVDVDGDNIRQNDAAMDGEYPHRWVTDSGNNEDGSGTFGRHAQRKSVVQALQATVNSNQDIRDEESRQFNLIATPGYPELIGEMITLNYDRRLTAFVVGDTPFRLTPDATSLNEWATNVRLAVEDNDNGAVSFDEYMAMYYGAGYTSDNFGNNIVVPPSYMALRTIVLNDQVAFPWFAPAGTRRGGVTNATASGYINSEGEFVSVALNTGQRDTLYSNSINPITFLSGAGLTVFGQKTRARNASALDRVNVARLVVYLRGQLELLAKPYLFEPNDKITRDQIKAAADALLLELVALRALYDFLVVCDESNNTPSRIDRNELWIDIAIEPVKAIEFIYIPLRIKNTGEIAALG